MILPGSYTAALILLIAGMFAFGLWANLFKAAGGKWRYELFYFDFAIGVLIAAAVLGLTAGSLGFDGFGFRDDLQLAGKRQDLWASRPARSSIWEICCYWGPCLFPGWHWHFPPEWAVLCLSLPFWVLR